LRDTKGTDGELPCVSAQAHVEGFPPVTGCTYITYLWLWVLTNLGNVYLLIEGSPERASRLLAELREHQGLAKSGAAVHMGINPASGKAQRSILAALPAV